jgi:hypothetical protein
LTVVVTDPLGSLTVHDTGLPPVSLEIVTDGQLDALHLTVTFAVCHAEQSAGPGEHVGIG